MNIPENVYYTKEHEWIRMKDGIAFIGVTDFAQGELGDIVYVDIDSEGETLAANEVFGSIEAVKTVSDLFMPIAGEIIAINEALEDEPELVNSDPYDKGWLIQVRPDNPADVAALLSPASYKAEVGID